MRRVLLLALIIAGVALILGARSVDSPFVGSGPPEPDARPDGDRAQDRESAAPGPERAVRCPSGVPDCRAVAGRIVFVERVDPDGDGDLHVVLAGGGVTGPGVTAVDVRPGLRPRRDPGIGDRASAAGPVQRGSFGQRQIHALRFRVHR